MILLEQVIEVYGRSWNNPRRILKVMGGHVNL